MIQARWWDAVMAAGLIANTVLLAASAPFNRNPAAWAVIAAFAVMYLLVARREMGRTNGPVTPALFAVAAATAVLVGFGTYLYPALATLQCIAYPLVWTLPWSLRPAVVANVGIATAVFLGYGLAPVGGDSWLESLAIALLSLAFSLVLGVWISRIAAYGIERARLVDELTAAQDELAAMHRQAGETSERARLARELHDTVTQSLTGLVMLAERAGAQLGAGRVAEAAASVAVIESTARDVLGEARALVATTTPVSTESGLADALHRLAGRFERETGVAVETRVAELRLPREHEVVLLRCAQEGLANVRKHARARHVVIDVQGGPGAISLTVCDDGVGVPAAGVPEDSGFGVAGMRERVGMLGGTLALRGRPGGGAELAVSLPAVAA